MSPNPVLARSLLSDAQLLVLSAVGNGRCYPRGPAARTAQRLADKGLVTIEDYGKLLSDGERWYCTLTPEGRAVLDAGLAPAMPNDIDQYVFEAVRSLGGATSLEAIQATARAPLSARQVGASLRRLRATGRVHNHDGHGTLARWRSVSPNKLKWWSTIDTLRRDYGYTDKELGLEAPLATGGAQASARGEPR